MKRTIAGMVAGILIGGGSVFGATMSREFLLHQGDHVNYRGIRCGAMTSLICSPDPQSGYAIGISTDSVIVVRWLSGGKAKTVFFRSQP